MKKILLGLVLVVTSIMLVGCNKSITKLAKENMSEITNIYFSGENDIGKGSISVGEREDPYSLDGVHRKNVAFSLIILELKQQKQENSIQVEVKINEKNLNVTLEFDPKNSTYIQDLGFQVKSGDNISIVYDQQVFKMINISKDFKINSKKAVELCVKKLESKLEKYVNGNRLSGECYLKVMHMPGDKDSFWGFSFLGADGKSFNAILNVNNENVIV